MTLRMLSVVALCLLCACSSERPLVQSTERDPSRERSRDAGSRDQDQDDDADERERAPRSDDDRSDGAAPSEKERSDAGGKSSAPPPVRIDDCAQGGALTPSEVQKLKAGGSGSARILYPYDGTVFPRGTEGPLLMWDGPIAEAVYLRIHSSAFDYEGCLKPTGLNQLQLPAKVWDTAGDQTGGKSDPFAIELSVLSGGQVVGPLRQKWIIAKASFKGSVYYNSYSSLSGGATGGKVFRIPPRGKAEGYLVTECNGCHSLSANGSRMVSQTLAMGGRTYDVDAPTPRSLPAPTSTGFAAMYPDGSRYVVGSGAVVVGRMAIASPLDIASDAALFDTDSGKKLTSQGLPKGALMPSFSPDGKLLAFNDAALGAAALAMVKFDATTNSASDYKKLIQIDGGQRPGWPFVLPDNRAVVYVRTDGIDFSGNGAGVGIASVTQILAPYSELFIVDVASGKSTVLARAMGYESAEAAAQGKSYLPFPDDTRKAYFPTVSPVAAGGYVWVFFDAIRHYGNLGLQRQLWGTAVELSPTGDYSVDRSAPAFYLPGQEFGTGNHRAFTALDPCKGEGESCESGVDCCDGSCHREGKAPGTCAPVESCAQTEERCATDADCCVEGDRCIAGFCSAIFVQ